MSVNCPGFKPHGVKPTRCRRCFKEYNDHIKRDTELNGRKLTIAKSSKEEIDNTQSPKRSCDADVKNKTTLSDLSIKTGNSASLSRIDTYESKVGRSEAEIKDDFNTASKTRARTRTNELQIADNSSNVAQTSLSAIRRTRVRPVSMIDMEQLPLPSTSFDKTRVRTRERRLEPDGAELNDNEKLKSSVLKSVKPKTVSPKRVKIIDTLEVENNNNKMSVPPDSNSNLSEKTSSDVEFILRVKTANQSKEYDEDSIAATDTTETTLVGYQDTIDDYQSKLATLMAQFEKAEEKVKSLEKENCDLKKLGNKSKFSDTDKQTIGNTASDLVKLRAKVRELETINTEYKDKNNVLKIEVKELNSEVYALKRENPKELKEMVTNLRLKLQQTEQICEQLTEENEEMKKDVKSLEDEFQELHDSFREDQTSEFRVLKRELETTSKNCRILQFKLKKTERSFEVLDNEKLELEKKVKDLLETSKLDYDKHKMKELETELSIAKEVSLKLHAEIEILKEERIQMEKQLAESTKPKFSTKSNRLSAGNLSPSVSFESKDYEAVVRDLYDTMEREKDLQEQMKFTEEEVRTMRKKLSTMEQENEILMMQIRKMANQNRTKKVETEEEDEELSPEEMKLHLELYEQEMVVLRRKTDELEQENENFQTEIKYLQEKLVSQPLARVEIPEIPAGSPPNVIYEHKIRILETEARELRKKLVDREKENESLRTEIDVHRRKASKVIIRSRSLDSNEQVDLKRQLQLVEQEASILRQKITSLEGENDKLANDNKRMQLRLSRKPPPGPADQLQIENLELKDKIKNLEQRCDNFKGELASSKSQTNLSNLFVSDTETDVINTLKKQLKAKETEMATLNSKVAQMDVENNRLNREYKKMKEAVTYKKKPMRVVRETATRMELKDIIKDLETDVSDLQMKIKAKDVIIENFQEELSEAKRETDLLQNKSKGTQQSSDLNKIQSEYEKLKKDFESEKKRCCALQNRLDMIAKDKGIDTSSIDKVETLQAEKKEMAIKLEDTEAELIKDKSKIEDLNEKLLTLSKIKEELTANNGSLQKQKEKFEDELEVQKEKLKKSETKLKELTNKYETINKEYETNKKDAQQLKVDLAQEKSKLAAINSRASGVSANSVLIQKERDDLKRQLQEANAKCDELKNQIEKLEKEFIDKEKNIKEEYTKKMDVAVKDVRKEVHKDLQSMSEQTTNYKTKVNELMEKLDKTEKEFKDINEKLKQANVQMRKERDECNRKANEYENVAKNEQKKREKIEKENESLFNSKEEDLLKTRERVVQLEREQRKAQSHLESVSYEFENKISSLERDLAKETNEYEELTTKYDMLEKDFVAMKSRLIAEKDTLVEAISSIRKSYDEKLIEIKSLKDALTNRQKDWFNEKISLQEKIASLEAKLNRVHSIEDERNKLKDSLAEKEKIIDTNKKEEKQVREDRERLRRRIDELQDKVTEMERKERSQRTMSITGRTQADKDLHDYRIKLEHSQTSHKGDLAALHAEYEGRMKLMNDEMIELQRQISLLVSERDMLRDQVHRDPLLRRGSKHKEDSEDLMAQIYTIRRDLEAALLENRNMKIQHGTERSSWQIQIADLRGQINQSEERILLESRGTTRNYAKTKMELAWDKERQENQRILQETQKFIQEMRDKLLASESLREKDKQESRKQLQDLKGVIDKEQEDTHKHVGELQLDLLDLRESHSKLRSQNDRLRRERASYEKEREDWRLTIYAAIDIQNKSTEIIKELEELYKLVPKETENKDAIETKDTLQVESRVRRRRSASPAINIEELKNLMEKLMVKNEELKKVSVPIKDEDRLRRALTFKHAISASELVSMKGSAQSLTRTPLPIIRAPPRAKALAKKSISLDHAIGVSGVKGSSQERIWDSEDSAQTTPTSSISNLRVGGPYRGFTSYTGYESESSTGGYSYAGDGTGSDVSAPAAPKIKKSLKEKFRLIKKTNSIEDSQTGGNIAHAGLTPLALQGFDPSPIEIAKQREKKEHSLRSRISKTLSKTFSRSSSALEKGENFAHKAERTKSPTRPMSPISFNPSHPLSQSSTPFDKEGSKSSRGETSKTQVFGRSSSRVTTQEAPKTDTSTDASPHLTSKLAIPPTRLVTVPRQTRV